MKNLLPYLLRDERYQCYRCCISYRTYISPTSFFLYLFKDVFNSLGYMASVEKMVNEY
jgi:hypothetical protein